MHRGIRLLSWVAPVFVIAGCAAGGETAPATPQAGVASDLAVIEIMHNDPAMTSAATVLIEPAAGVRSTLGVVDPGQTRQFSYNATPGNYRLIIPGGKSSPEFRLSNREIATWDMQLNRVRMRNKD